MTRKQELDRALAEEARRVAEKSQGVVRKEASPSMAFSTGVSLQNVDPVMVAALQEWMKNYGK